ncbi:OLC1v1006574C1 [Oldenlandia corymbosa var. corymbosa]|uniref:Protein ZIP4 homolog n=1 Tax=Oldenlandia corymbosa var. corymbosa TaxID=529605 RepID=A0AAV1DJJ8_OLDCO|nr:OLC1v1006574C1 [Oldenlandia corymbosa var. corymbosa]
MIMPQGTRGRNWPTREARASPDRIMTTESDQLSSGPYAALRPEEEQETTTPAEGSCTRLKFSEEDDRPKRAKGTTTLAFVCKKGVMVATDHLDAGKDGSEYFVENVIDLDSHVLVTVSGVGDSRSFLRNMREQIPRLFIVDANGQRSTRKKGATGCGALIVSDLYDIGLDRKGCDEAVVYARWVINGAVSVLAFLKRTGDSSIETCGYISEVLIAALDDKRKVSCFHIGDFSFFSCGFEKHRNLFSDEAAVIVGEDHGGVPVMEDKPPDAMVSENAVKELTKPSGIALKAATCLASLVSNSLNGFYYGEVATSDAKKDSNLLGLWRTSIIMLMECLNISLAKLYEDLIPVTILEDVKERAIVVADEWEHDVVYDVNEKELAALLRLRLSALRSITAAQEGNFGRKFLSRNMRIVENSSPELRSGHTQESEHYSHAISRLEFSITKLELLTAASLLPETLSSDVRLNLSELTQLAPFPNSVSVQIWELSYRLWNACVDLHNASLSGGGETSEELAKLRQVSTDLLYIAVNVVGIPTPSLKCASFFYKTGLIWHDIRKFDLANNCFEKAADLMSKVEIDSEKADNDEQKLFLNLNLARSRTAWEIPDRSLAITLLNRSKKALCGNSEHYKVLASQYLMFGKDILSKNEVSGLNEALKLMNEALELSEKGLRIVKKAEETLALKELRTKTLRFMAAVHLQRDEFENVLKCVRILRDGGGDQHPSLSVLAMKAWLGLARYGQAEKELKGMVVNKGIPEVVWVSAVESYFQAAGVAGAETVKGLFLGLLERCHVSAISALRVVNRLVGDGGGGGGEGSRARAKVVAELVSDDRVVALFAGEEVSKERTTMHSLLWNCAAEHFQSKDFQTSSLLFEKCMLYVPYNIESRVLRAKGFKVLCLCHLGLSQLDQAQEYINEAEKLEPSIASVFLKFKIYLPKNDHIRAISQVEAMSSCLDFTPDFLSLAAHEAIASQSLPVAVASLSNLLNFYSSGKTLPTNEVVVFRTLVTLLTQAPGDASEILKYMNRVLERVSAIGSDCCFGKGEVGRQEMNWFAMNSWNHGLHMAKAKRFGLSAQFFRSASDFYAISIDGEEGEHSVMVCKCLILSVSATLADEEETNIPLQESEVKQAIELSERAGKILLSTSAISWKDDSGDAIIDNFVFMHCWSLSALYARLVDRGQKQLALIKSLASSKSCNPLHLLQIGLDASHGPQSNPEVATFALNTCLSALLGSPSPDYHTVAQILRHLIMVSTVSKGDADDEAVLGIYKQAFRIMVDLREGEYPSKEAKWLSMTAWNRAAIPLRLGNIEVAKKWMNMGLELAKKVTRWIGIQQVSSERLSLDSLFGVVLLLLQTRCLEMLMELCVISKYPIAGGRPMTVEDAAAWLQNKMMDPKTISEEEPHRILLGGLLEGEPILYCFQPGEDMLKGESFAIGSGCDLGSGFLRGEDDIKDIHNITSPAEAAIIAKRGIIYATLRDGGKTGGRVFVHFLNKHDGTCEELVKGEIIEECAEYRAMEWDYQTEQMTEDFDWD